MPSSSPQEVEVLLPLLVSLGTILVTVVVHGIALMAVINFIRREYRLGRAGTHFWRNLAIVTAAMQVALVAHLIEVAIWAGVLGLCGEFTRFATAFYHSAMNYTSLGYGDVVMSPSWKLLGPLEAANGMLMFGISTAMIFAVIQRLVQPRIEHQRG
jgi:hypothetical protein